MARTSTLALVLTAACAVASPKEEPPVRVEGVPVYFGEQAPAIGQTAPDLVPIDPSRTYRLTGLYRPRYDRIWSAYPQSPASLVGAGAGNGIAEDRGLDILPLTGALKVPDGAIVTLRARPVVSVHEEFRSRIVRFAPLRPPEKVVRTAKARGIVERFHARFHKRLHGLAVDRLRSSRHAGGEGPKLPEFDPKGPFGVVLDSPSRRLFFTARASWPLSMHLLADYVLDPPYNRIKAIHLHWFFQGE